MAHVKFLGFPIFSLLLLVFVIKLVQCNVPVLLWESSSISDKDDLIPALYQLDSDEFSNHLVKKIHQHKPLVVLFLEESLSVEDFSWKDDHGQGSFSQLQNLTSMSAKTEFVTSVYDPVASLRDIVESQDYSWVKYDGKTLPKTHTVLEVTMEDPSAEEDRPELLRRHDSSIAETYSRLLSKYSHILALFTGKYSSWVEPEYNRVRRDADNATTASSEMFDLTVMFTDKTYAILRSSQPPTLVTDGSEVDLGFPLNTFPDQVKANRSIVATFKDKTHLRITFIDAGGYWKLTTVTLNDKIILTPSEEISRPIGTPFKSDVPIEFSQGTTTLKFVDLQVQAFANDKNFGKNLTVFFTVPILMAVFITAILGVILSWAIIMMMDIKTMDRFDDPKGKTITIAQTE